MILIGSRALMFRAPMLLRRKPKDFDFIATKEEALTWLDRQSIVNHKMVDGKIIAEGEPPCEFELIKEGNSNEMFVELVKKDPQTLETSFGLVPNLNLLFTLKSSHKYLKNSPHFWKNAEDYHKMKQVGAEILPEYMEFFKLREKETYNYLHPNLNQDKKNFFADDSIKYIWDHDDIHKAVALNDRPAYTYYMKDGEEVKSSKEKFFKCSEDIRLAGGIEEAAVLAIERSLVPHAGKMTPKQAWIFALSKVCSSITSGFFRSYCFEHIFKIVKLYPENYYERFLNAVEKGLVKRV